MNFSVIPSDMFKRDVKRLVKKFPSLKQELVDLNSDNNEVYLLTIYDKSEFDSVDDKTIKLIIESLNPGN